MWIRAYQSVETDQRTIEYSRSGDDNLIGGIAVKKPRKFSRFHGDFGREWKQLNAGVSQSPVHPSIQGDRESPFPILDELGHFPT
jgi:hypothetical protein